MNSITTTEKEFQEITSEEFQEKMKHPGFVVLDVRTPDEWLHGYIFDSRKLDIHHPNFEKEIEKFDKKKDYLVYCLKGQRSAEACKLLAKHGFKKLYNLEGGLLKWDGPLHKL
jgi:rhodanese-related sulfurtransferase